MNDTELKNENSINILIVDDEDTILDILSTGFKKRGMRPYIAKESDSAISILKQNPIHFSLIDVRLPGKTGIELCNEISSISPKTFNIIMTGYPGVKSAVEAMKNNAHDYLIKPFRIELVLDVINRAFEESMIETENDILVQSLREENKKLRKMIKDLSPVSGDKKDNFSTEKTRLHSAEKIYKKLSGSPLRIKKEQK